MDSPAQGGRTCDRADALAVVRTLRDAGHVAYFAGGCVRDLLLGLEPKDYDVATDAPPDRVRELFRRTQAVGQAFGVILVRVGRSQVEVATFRAEGRYLDGRRPSEVRFTTSEEDAKRRDFTINGLFMDPLDGDRVIDYVGGQADLEAKIIRAIGNPDERFGEDHLRLLRAVRFAARFAFQIEPGTAEAVRRHAPMIKRISPERIAEELRNTTCPVSRMWAWPPLWELGLVREVLRFLPGWCDAQGFDAHGSVFLKVTPLRPITFGAALAAAVVCVGWQCHRDVRLYLGVRERQAAVAAMRRGLKISNDEAAEMDGTLEGVALALADVPLITLGVAKWKRFLARPTSRASRDLLHAIRAATGEFADRVDPLRDELERLEQTDYAPPPLVTGDDLTAAGHSPGPAFKRVLDGVYDAQLEGRVRTRDEAMQLAGRMFAEGMDGGR